MFTYCLQDVIKLFDVYMINRLLVPSQPIMQVVKFELSVGMLNRKIMQLHCNLKEL